MVDDWKETGFDFYTDCVFIILILNPLVTTLKLFESLFFKKVKMMRNHFVSGGKHLFPKAGYWLGKKSSAGGTEQSGLLSTCPQDL